jgi:hypothetical protein
MESPGAAAFGCVACGGPFARLGVDEARTELYSQQ